MASIQTQNQPNLPQEMINLIIDNLADLNESPLKTRAALRACCLVARSFAYSARKQLWKNITLSVDGTLTQRCNRFAHILEGMDDKASMISEVRSLKLVFREPTMRQQSSGQKQRKAVLRSIKRIFGKQYDIFDVFQMLKNPNFTHLSLAAPDGTSFLWGQGIFFIQPPILQILSCSDLKSFALCNITSVSQEIVAAAFFSRSIQELTIRSIFVGYRRTPPGAEISGPLADLRKLEMTDVSVPALFRMIFDFLQNSNVPRPLFPRLQTLVISVPSELDNMNPLREYVLGSSAALETLEMEFHVRQRYSIRRFSL